MRPVRRRDAEQERQTAVSPSGLCRRSGLVPTGDLRVGATGPADAATVCVCVRASVPPVQDAAAAAAVVFNM